MFSRVTFALGEGAARIILNDAIADNFFNSENRSEQQKNRTANHS